MPQPQPEVEIVPVEGPGDFAAALAIREVVFIEEQRVPEEIERDDEDPTAYHVLAQVGGHAIGTGRLVELKKAPHGAAGRWGQIGRMAVLVAHRRGRIGSKILAALERKARDRGLDGIVLHAQVYAHGFYEHVGYRDNGPIFDEAGIPHVEMRKSLHDTPPLELTPALQVVDGAELALEAAATAADAEGEPAELPAAAKAKGS